MLENPTNEARFHSTKEADEPEQRRFDRFKVELDVSLGSEHNFYAGFVENMSQGGIFIATHQLKDVGEKLAFTVNLPGFDAPVEGVGEVRWVRMFSEESHVPPGIGLRFIELHGDSLRIIETFLKDREPIFYED